MQLLQFLRCEATVKAHARQKSAYFQITRIVSLPRSPKSPKDELASAVIRDCGGKPVSKSSIMFVDSQSAAESV